jgi:hypothetical protein
MLSSAASSSPPKAAQNANFLNSHAAQLFHRAADARLPAANDINADVFSWPGEFKTYLAIPIAGLLSVEASDDNKLILINLSMICGHCKMRTQSIGLTYVRAPLTVRVADDPSAHGNECVT